ADADGADLPIANPCSGQAVDPPGGDPVVAADANHRLFQVAHVAVHVAPIGIQIEDRVTDDLSRPVIGDVSAAAGLEHLHAELREARVGRDDVRAAASADP